MIFKYWCLLILQADITNFRTKLAAILVTCQQNNVEECPSLKKLGTIQVECPDEVVCLGTATDLLNTPQSTISNAELIAGEENDEESVNKRKKTVKRFDTNDLNSEVPMSAKNLDELLENTKMEEKKNTMVFTVNLF